MTVLARIIDNHWFGLLTVSLVIIALADTLSDFGTGNSIEFSEKKSATLNHHAALAERRAGDRAWRCFC